jgi:hypothetical protein
MIIHKQARIVAVVAVFIVSNAVAGSVVKFVDMRDQAGISFHHVRAAFHQKLSNVMPWLTAGGAGVSLGDYNNDGLDDIYFVSSGLGALNHLYRNDGNFKFTEVALPAGLAKVNETRETGTSSAALWLDYNGDGWQDLFLLRFGKTALFRNNKDGTFTEVTQESGVRRHTNALSVTAFDYDRDGDLDIFIGGYFSEKDFQNPDDTKVLFDSWETARNGGRNYLFRNNSDGTFSEVAEEAGFQDTGWTMAVGHGDINNDGWQDIYLANDFGTDKLFKNIGGRFVDISGTAIGVDTKKGMNADFADYNNDGSLDIYVTNMTEPYLHECNMLWRNNGDETFSDVSVETQTCDTKWGWGAKFVDIDNDGRLDIYAANGFVSAGKTEYMEVLLDFVFDDKVDVADARGWPKMGDSSMAGFERNMLLRQTTSGFASIGKEAGVDSIGDGRGVAVADFDNDGRMDIVVTNVNGAPHIYRNTTEPKGNWLELRLTGTGGKSNLDAIGTRILVRTADGEQIREVASANGFNAQSSLQAHFGLGKNSRVDYMKIVWPDGAHQEFRNVAGNKVYHLRQNKTIEVFRIPTARVALSGKGR